VRWKGEEEREAAEQEKEEPNLAFAMITCE